QRGWKQRAPRDDGSRWEESVDVGHADVDATAHLADGVPRLLAGQSSARKREVRRDAGQEAARVRYRESLLADARYRARPRSGEATARTLEGEFGQRRCARQSRTRGNERRDACALGPHVIEPRGRRRTRKRDARLLATRLSDGSESNRTAGATGSDDPR